MASYRARQIMLIREAVAAGREALRAARSDSPLVFARAFIAAGGVQIPGRLDAPEAVPLAARLLAELDSSARPAMDDDADLRREVARVRREVDWVAAQRDDLVVGFHLRLPDFALDSPTAEALSHENHGLGPGVFRKSDIVVLQPDCDEAVFTPVTSHEIEC